jgi:hypothetical protein
MSLSQVVRFIGAGMLVLGFVGSAAAQSPADARLSKKEVKALLASASTPADHEKLARHFEAKAAAFREDAVEHEELAASYRTPPPSTKGVPPVQWGQHCKSLATSLGNASTEARKLSDLHKQLAKESTKSR